TGSGSDTSHWRAEDPGLEPGATYEFSTWMRRAPEALGGLAITGPSFANMDRRPGEEWAEGRHVFVVPREAEEAYIRVGQWHADGTIFFDDVSLLPVTPLPVRRGALELGQGETVDGSSYSFTAPLGGYTGNYSRPLHSHTAHFNSHRWVFFPGAEVIYRHEIGGLAMTGATIEPQIGWYAAGICIVEVGTDGRTWTQVGEMSDLGRGTFEVPAETLPAEEIYVRLRSPGEGERGESAPGSFQIYNYGFRAELAEAVEPLRGATTFLVPETTSDRLAVDVRTLGGLLPGMSNEAVMTLRNLSDDALDLRPMLLFEPEGAEPASFDATVTVPAGGEAEVSIPYAAGVVGSYEAALIVADAAGEELYRARFTFQVPELYRSNFGYPVASDDAAELWWCEGTYKVNRDRPAPTGDERSVMIEACRGEYEPVQVIIRPRRPISGLTAAVSDLAGDGGAAIPAEQIDILRVAYVYVHTPTDSQGAVGWWPDPLPPLDAPVDLEADRNQPLWVRVHVPADAAPGRYEGTLSLEADGWSAQVPLRLRVFDFEMPAERSIVATMGFSSGTMRHYHHLETDEQTEDVFDRYMRNFRAHRIDPYSPMLQSIRTQLEGVEWTGGEMIQSEDAPEGQNVLHILDASETDNPSAATADLIEVDRERDYRLGFMARAAQGHQFQTTVTCHDAAGEWMSGCNIDTLYEGTGEWARYETPIPAGRMAEGCQGVRVTLRASRWVESGETTGEAWFDDVFFGLAEEGAPNLVPDPSFEMGARDVRIVSDYTDFDYWMERYVDGLGFQSVRLPIGYMPRRDAPGHVGPYWQGTEAYDRIVGEYLHDLQEHLREKGWLDVGYAYWVDEPAPEHYENVRYGMRLLDEYAPDIARMLTEQPEEELVGFVDIWCPVLHNYDEEACHERQRDGDTIWWYVCTGPKAPYAGLFIDHNAVDLRIWQWMGWKYDVQGCLIWATNYYTSGQRRRETGQWQNPWDDPMAYRASGGGWWGNGDGRFIYPPNVDPNSEHEPIITGPVDSIRWEMLREGLEDREYFEILRALVEGHPEDAARELLTIPESIVTNPREFTRDPLPLYERRRALMEAIERLSREG
ncbi:MAG: glycoside hydrolase domain-containing protein, partial [Armatimonadota bacterium]